MCIGFLQRLFFFVRIRIKMGSHILEILRQGLWASLTGGWFYDPHQNVFCNTFHLYVWLFLLCFPLTLYLTLPAHLMVWTIYSVTLATIFTFIKVVNYRLHCMFDTGEVVEEDPSEDSDNKSDKNDETSKVSETGVSKTQTPGETAEGIEMAVINADPELPSITPPIQCSSRNSVVDGSTRSSGRKTLPPADSMDYINKLVRDEIKPGRTRSSTHDLKVEVHRRDSEGEGVACTGAGDYDLRLPMPGTMPIVGTTEHNPKILNTVITPNATPDAPRKHSTSSDPDIRRLKAFRERLGTRVRSLDSSGHHLDSPHSQRSRYSSFEYYDSEDTPKFKIKPRKARKAVRRTKSALDAHVEPKLMCLDPREPQDSFVKPPRQASLPEEPRFVPDSILSSQFNPDIQFSTPSRPLELGRPSSELDNSSLSSYKETSPECEISPEPAASMPQLSSNANDSISEMALAGFRSRTQTPSTRSLSAKFTRPRHGQNDSLKNKARNSDRGPSRRPAKRVSSSASDIIDASDVTIIDETAAGTLSRNASSIRSNTDTDSSRTLTEQSQHTDTEDKEQAGPKSDKKCLAFKLPAEVLDNEDEGLEPHSHQTSEQSSVMDLDVLFQGDRAEGSSTLTNNDSSSSSDNHRHLFAANQLSSSSTSPSLHSPEADSWALVTQKGQGQGARPKQRTGPAPARSPDTEDSYDESSFLETADTKELSRRLLQILNKSNPMEAEEELKKLKEELNARNRLSEYPASDRSLRRSRPRDPYSRRERRPKVRARRRLNADTGSTTPQLSQPDADRERASSRESSTSNNNESSALLPDLPSVAGAEKLPSSTEKRSRRRHSSRASKSSAKSDCPPVENMETLVPVGEDKHLATTHDDTTEGAVHCFQDEFGNWYSYSFGENSTGIAATLPELLPAEKIPPDKWVSSSSESDSTVILETPTAPRLADRPSTPIPNILDMGRSPHAIQHYVEALLESGQRRTMDDTSDTDTNTSRNATSSDEKPKHYYKFFVVPLRFMKIWFDRLALLALLDRNNILENLMSIALAVGVGVLGAALLSHSFFHDFWIFGFCFVMAGCQYSLLKSVQPDAASPMHGYNRIIVFSRPFYFCVCGVLVLALHYAAENWTSMTFDLYGMPFTTSTVLYFARDLVKIFLLCLPIIFTIGLLPQVNTFLMYLLEQIEIHVFGGNGTNSLVASTFTVGRSILAVVVLYGFCYVGIKDPVVEGEDNTSQHVLFSIYCGLLVPVSYHLSRSTSDPTVLWQLTRCAVWPKKDGEKSDDDNGDELIDPLPEKMQKTLDDRLRSDLIVCCASAVLVFAVSVSTAFSSPVLQPTLFDVLAYVAGSLGFVIHYVVPQLRKEMPWLCCSHPVLPSHERDQFEVREAAKVMWFEKAYVWLRFFERNFMYPAVFLSAVTTSAQQLVERDKFGIYLATFLVVLCSLKMFRCAFSDTPRQFMILIFTTFFFKYDYSQASETFIIDYFFMSILFNKFYDLMLKMKFILTYIAPWQITWGSAFHAFAQPFSVPHSAMLFLQAIVSAFFSTPLNPLLGSAIFFTSYVRPIKFWERDYNTKRVDHTNTRLSSQLERNPGSDDNNLNSIFYEHLTRSLQHSLCGDILMGRWSNVCQGDCFIMASDYLNALVHIIEIGNGLVTFQLRGLEFRGTYCQQREVEAITEGVEEDTGFCCCHPGYLPHFLSLNAAFNQRWLAWEVLVGKYVLEGYSISDNSAATMLQVFDLRKVLITYYVKSIIYYTVRSPKLEQWLTDESIQEGLRPMLDSDHIDLDPTFNLHVDEDFDSRLLGVSKNSFCNVYLDWIQYCASRRDKSLDANKESWLVSLCFGLSLLGRRALGTASHNNASASVDFFLYGLHALFKGDFRITSIRDEWVFKDMEMLRRVVAPGIRMSLKLHQDHFTAPDEYDDPQALYDAITNHEQSMVISHEADPAWRNAVLSNTPSLLALRHVFDEGSGEYKVIMLNKRYLSFRVIKVNRECVRGLWAGQLQELIYLRNRNPERGSIQNAKQALRNMINSSCDQPIGYPIYVSPLTTSYSSTNDQYCSMMGKEFSLKSVTQALRHLWRRMRGRCGASCTSGSSGMGDEAYGCPSNSPHNLNMTSTRASTATNTPSTQQPDSTHPSITNRGSLVSTSSSASKPNIAFVSAAFEATAKEPMMRLVKVVDASMVYDNINLGRRIDVLWPSEYSRLRGGKNHWNGWVPEKGMEGHVVHTWQPCHRELLKRSHVDKTILLVVIGDRFVPIAEAGIEELGAER